jgi:hypothetical protein
VDGIPDDVVRGRGRPVEHLEEPAGILAAFEDEAEGTW